MPNARAATGRSARQFGMPHQVLVDCARGLAAFADRPHDQRLAAPRVAAGEDVADAGPVVGLGRLDVAAPVEFHAQVADQPVVHRVDESHGQQDQPGFYDELAAGDLRHPPLAVVAPLPLQPGELQPGDLAVGADDLFGHHRPVALAAFLVRGRTAQLQRPVGPGEKLVLVLRWARHDLELRDARGALTVGRADAVRAGIAASDHDHVPAGGEDVWTAVALT